MAENLRFIVALYLRGGLPCLFHEWTGLYCPGCGGTRALKALLKGHFFLSVQYHPLVPYGALVALLFAASYGIYGITGKQRFRLSFGNGYIYVGVLILLVNFIYKNYMLIGRGIDILERLPKV